jgi:hypothetical protein
MFRKYLLLPTSKNTLSIDIYYARFHVLMTARMKMAGLVKASHQTARRKNPEDSHLNTGHRQNLNPYLNLFKAQR